MAKKPRETLDAAMEAAGPQVVQDALDGARTHGVSAEAFRLSGGSTAPAAVEHPELREPSGPLRPAPGWAVNTPDPHVPWPEPSSDAHDMDFGDAIRCLKRGQYVQRAGWNGKGMFLRYVEAQAWSFGSGHGGEPFIAMFTVQKTWVPWLASQADVLADDWRVFG